MANTPTLGSSDSVLGLSQILGAPNQGSLSKSVLQGLGLSQQAVGLTLGPVRVSNVSLQVLWSPGLLYADASNSLGLSDQALDFVLIDDRKIVVQVLAFSQASDFGEDRAADNLALVQSVSFTGPIEVFARNNLGLQQGITPCFGAPWEPIGLSDTLILTQRVEIPLNIVSVNQVLSLSQTTADRYYVSDSLVLQQNASAGSSYSVSQQLNISQQFTGNATLNRTVEQTGVIKQAFTFHTNNECSKKQYARFEGFGEEQPLPEKRLAFKSTFLLESLSSPKLSVTLRPPESDDRHRLSVTRVNRETRGGELSIFGDPIWPEVETLQVTITNLKQSQAENLQDFLVNTLGQEIKLQDWKGTAWIGVITTPDEVLTEDHTNRWTALFDFEGVAQDSQLPDDQLDISQSVQVQAVFNRTAEHDLNLVPSASFIGPKYVSASNVIPLTDSKPSFQSILLMEELFDGAGSSLHANFPNTGNNQWVAHSNYRNNGQMSAAVEGGAYYPFVPQQGRIYSVYFNVRNLVLSDGNDSLFFFAKGYPNPANLTGNPADGTTGFTTLRAGHALKSESGGANHAYRRGNQFSGLADTQVWSDATLRQESPDVDLKIVLNTQGGSGNWSVQFFAKDTMDSNYTAVSPDLSMLSEDVSAVGYANNTYNTQFEMAYMSIVEERPL